MSDRSDFSEFIRLGQKPRNAENADSTGEYRLVPRVRQSQVDPGQEITLELYITGYGTIQGPKLVFFPPPSFIDEQNSRVLFGISQKEGVYVFGESEHRFGDGLIVDLAGGIRASGWAEPTLFFDLSSGEATNRIATETSQRRAPIEMHLKTQVNAPAGEHSLQFYLTYYNGKGWKTDSRSVSISVSNFFQRHPYVTWVIGIVGALIALGSFARTNSDILLRILKPLIGIPILGATVIGLLCIGVPLFLYRANVLPIKRP